MQLFSAFFTRNNPLSHFLMYLGVFVLLATFDVFQGRFDIVQLIPLTAYLAIAYVVQKYISDRNILTDFQPEKYYVVLLTIYVLISPSNQFIYFPLMIGLYVAGLYFFQEYKNIFNPVALWICVVAYVSAFLASNNTTFLPLDVSWWGANMRHEFLSNHIVIDVLLATFLIYGFVFFVFKFRRTIIVGTFFMMVMLLVYYTNLQTHYSSYATIDFLTTGLFSAFAFLMLVLVSEPDSTPDSLKQQALVGGLGGALFYYFTFVNVQFLESIIVLPALITVLCMNILSFYLKQSRIFE